jgi:hypothetical protein
MLEPNAELVLFEDPQPLQLGSDDLQGVEFAPFASVRPSLSPSVSPFG